MSIITKVLVFILGTRGFVSPGYSEFFWRAVWIFTSFFILSYVSYLYFGSVNAAYFGEPAPIRVLDVIKKGGVHHLSGEIPVPSSCHGLTVIPQEISETHFQLVFTTWQESSRTCEPMKESRSFNTIVFAPSTGVTFSALLNGKKLPIRITKRY